MVSINSSTIDVWLGDITDLHVDAIVNAANNHFWTGAGVAGAIKRRGGQTIEVEAMARGPVSVGQAVITTGGLLPAGKVIHAAAMGQDLPPDESKVREATRNSLSILSEHRLKSIAFPALGTGVAGLSLEVSALGMIDETLHFLKGADQCFSVTFALFDKKAFDVFDATLLGLVAGS